MRIFWLRRLLGFAMIAEGFCRIFGLSFKLSLHVAKLIAKENYRKLKVT